MPIVKAISDTIELIVQEEQRQWTCAEIPVLQAGICVPQCQSGHAQPRHAPFQPLLPSVRPFVSFILRTLLYPEALRL